ncbi:Zn-ribbon-containing protein [Actinobacillus pleuropneumoniae]|uniref:Zn-ribbon-containing protein n=1 Tax=Actinobacillus pleuropneumoniae TaxID=715 RepID=UPI00223D726E|nr:Zn-ribbon-containing protein [Actinobacillus pleuropneumoniae]
MYQVIANFSYQNFESDPVTLINQIINQWRFNGQIIGREFSVTYHQNPQAHFQVRVSTPEQTSLMPEWNSAEVNEALLQAEENGVAFESFEVVGRDYQAEQTSELEQQAFQILYTTHLDSCSPVYGGEDFCVIPLYKAIKQQQQLGEQLIKWQENWQACDQLQMNGGVLEQQALSQISEVDSELSQTGIDLCRQLETLSGVPTLYYLYRLGNDVAVEHQRKCPKCQGEWKLAQPLHQMFHFKCDKCRLISNLSWEVQ